MMELPNAGALVAEGSPRVQGWTSCRAALSESALISDPARAGLAAGPAGGSINNLFLMDGEFY